MTAPIVGKVLGGTYRILRELEQGGMGTVFEADHQRLHRHVAVKMLSPELTANAEVRERFEREAESVSRIEHPHVVTVLDYDVMEDGEPYLVLELLHGESLARRLERESPLPLQTAVAIVAQAAAGLSRAHKVSIVHRDLKPDNVFLVEGTDEPVFVKLLDFGISKHLKSARHLTVAQRLVGTPDYMAPEQALGRADLVDERTDQYALAVVAYEMLTGTNPFATSDLGETLRRVVGETPAPASTVASWLPEAVDAVLARAMSKLASERFGSVTEFSRALAAAAGATDVVPSSEPPPPAKIAKSSPSATTLIEADTSPVGKLVELTKSAVASSDFATASAHAEAALDLAERTGAPEGAIERAEPILARAFVGRLRSLGSAIADLDTTRPWQTPTSARTAFLLSRLDRGMSLDDALDVAAMSKLEALRRLVQLVECGAVRLAPGRRATPVYV